jgi:hypothetical protein
MLVLVKTQDRHRYTAKDASRRLLLGAAQQYEGDDS